MQTTSNFAAACSSEAAFPQAFRAPPPSNPCVMHAILREGAKPLSHSFTEETLERGSLIRDLTLTAFRTYERANLTFDRTLTVITGPNGAGKTNLLEALSLLAPGRGLRGDKPAQMTLQSDGAAAPSAGGWSVAAQISHPEGGEANGLIRVGTGYRPEPGKAEKRLVRIDGENRTQQALSDVLRLVPATPALDRLFLEPASGRRRFFDRLVAQFAPDHGRRLQAFERLARQRMKVLESEAAQPQWLQAMELDMAGEAVAIAAGRLDFQARLQGAINAWQGDTALFPQAELLLDGLLENELAARSALEVEDRYREALASRREKDRIVGRTTAGPHRTDFSAVHRQKGRGADQCSTGEQKALVLGLLLAQARLIAASAPTGAPVLLLDEIAAHFDRQRREALFEALQAIGGQVFMTGADATAFESLRGRADFLLVGDGDIQPLTDQ